MFRHSPKFTVVALVVAGVALAPAGDGLAQSEPAWSIFRPSNTGVVGDYNYTLTVDDQDRPWIAGFIPIWEDGGMSRKNPDGSWTVVSSDDSPVISSPRLYHIAKAACEH